MVGIILYYFDARFNFVTYSVINYKYVYLCYTMIQINNICCNDDYVFYTCTICIVFIVLLYMVCLNSSFIFIYCTYF